MENRRPKWSFAVAWRFRKLHWRRFLVTEATMGVFNKQLR